MPFLREQIIPYIALMARREAVVLSKPELDVKGVNFFKSTASKETTEFIYNNVFRIFMS